ncbi:helix-turn-helix domain-containing protein [Prevotella sp. E13-17]|uniref:helix-turn-helix domain-containing protein n=1 Tax=Prevotella sp. E13-17 TaxID=2913616 RepID=UPI001EDC616F|nr:helix-turn-helix domain-containing protein [Prevotella sp. E13-17]UKK51362.1 helix-turn-helix domain-containing protein [Prevotella sp. E13-17]
MRTLFVLLILMLASGAKAQQQTAASISCTVKKVQVERLPDLNIPRSGGSTLVINGIPYVMGGHTSGFVPTPTAEYFENGEWHVLPMVYTHDHGLCQPLPSGKVLLAAGHEKALGIGQTFTMELFDPETRTFEGYGCMEKKRFFPSSALLADGRVLISGNSYEEDCMEVFDGSRQSKFVKAVSVFRASPFIFPIASDDALVIGCMDGHMALNSDTVVVDRLKGDAPQMPLFNEWYPISMLLPKPAEDSRISQDSSQYTYLLLVLNKKSQEAAIAKLEGTDLQLLPTDCSIPMSVEAGGRLEWFTSVIVDRTIHRGYVVGRDERFHLYVLAVEYDKQPARLTLYETELQDSLPFSTPVLLPDGDLLMTGGITDNNFTPFATAYRFHLGTTDDVEAEAGNGWFWLSLLFIAVLTGGAAALWLLRRKRKPQSVAVPDDSTLPDNLLLARICDLMENEKPYLNSELKVADMAELVGTSSRNVSDCIKAARGCSFSQFVNAYRIDYVKQLLVSQPDIKVAAVALQSGFANEMSFFRTFKAITSMTPKEWKDSQAS